MALEKGDVVLVEYTLRLADTGEVIETTSEEVAKEAGIYKEDERYGPRIVVVGEGSLLPGLEEVITEMNEGEEREVEIPPEKAYGPRSPEKVKKFSLAEFRKAGIRRVYPGMVVEVGNQVGIVKSVGAGRVVVDFNHPFAGRTIKAKVKVVKIIKDVSEKVKALVDRRMPGAEVKVEGDTVTVEVPQRYLFADRIQVVKLLIANDIFKYVPEIKRVKFVETLERKEGGEEGSGQQ